MIVGTAGHVDHGKTSLVRALTGVDTDRLAEEKARGISIELGFAYTTLGDDTREPVGFVDVPGHRRFVQTMIAGAAGIDLGLLVIAADDGPMPQTREHLDILRWLGVRDVLVALTKVDAVDAARRAVADAEIRALLDGAPWADVPIVPVSVVSGEGLDALRSALQLARERSGPRATGDRFRLAVDRAFVLKGIGLVVTGTAFSGTVSVDDELVVVAPGHGEPLVARVRGIHAQDRDVASAHAGQRVALNLAGRGVEKETVHRGDWLVPAALAIRTERIDVVLLPVHGEADPPFSVHDWRQVRFHAGAASVNARVVRLRDAEGPMLAQVVFDDPQPLLAGDRFVLRDASLQDAGQATLAGGVVLDVDVPARGRRSDVRLAFLDTASRGDPVATLAHAVAIGAKGVDLARWNTTRNAALAGNAVDAVVVGETGAETLFSKDRWAALGARVLEVLAAEHARVPDAVGPGRDRLRRMSVPAMSPAAFIGLLDALRDEDRVARTGAWLHLPSHRVELSAQDQARYGRAHGVLVAGERYNPPRVRDIARALKDDEAAIRSVMIREAAHGALYRIAHDHYFLPDAVKALAVVAAELHATDGVVRAAPFRDRIAIGRKVAIQILEFFDRVGYTRRIGDDHRVIQPTLFDE